MAESGTPQAAAPAPRRWLVAVPTAITLGNALCGFAAVVILNQWPLAPWDLNIAWAGWLILAAWGCDMTDGLVARLTGTSGAFGASLDSLCDVVGFGVAPGYLVGVVASYYGAPTWLAFGAGAALLVAVLVRLARFDAEDLAADDGPDGHMWFRGLPSPVVGTVIAALALTWWQAAWGHGALAWLTLEQRAVVQWAISGAFPAVALLLALLAVSSLRYPDLPKHYLKRLAPRWHLLVLAIAAVVLGPGLALLLYFAAYLALGPLAGRDA